MKVHCPSFDNNGVIPARHTGFGDDISPALVVSEIPDGTVSLAVIMDDLDVPFCRRFNHWLIWNIPKTERIPEGLPKGAQIETPIHAVQGNAWGKHVYRGPKQPFFIRKEHRYVFRVYALDTMLDISKNAGKKVLLDAMHAHVTAEAEICSKYKRYANKHGKEDASCMN